MRFSELGREFTEYLVKRRGCSLGTKDTYDRTFDQFVGFLVSQGRPNDVAEFTADNVESFATWAAANHQGANSLRRHLSTLSALGKYGMRRKAIRGHGYLLDANPVDRVERPRFVAPREKWLTLDEIHTILAAEATPDEALALACVLDQPLRASEWCGATVSDLTLQGDKVALSVTVKGGGRVKKVLGDRLAEILTAQLRQREAKPTEPLLVNAQGRKYTRQGFSEVINRLAQRAGIGRNVRAHAIRHAVASLAAHQGRSVPEIAAMLNHRSLQTAQKYIHGVNPDAALNGVRHAIWEETASGETYKL